MSGVSSVANAVTDKPLRMHGRHFLQALADAGIIQNWRTTSDPHEYIYGVTIEAFINSAVKLTVHRFADDRMYVIKDLIEEDRPSASAGCPCSIHHEKSEEKGHHEVTSFGDDKPTFIARRPEDGGDAA